MEVAVEHGRGRHQQQRAEKVGPDKKHHVLHRRSVLSRYGLTCPERFRDHAVKLDEQDVTFAECG